MTWKRCAAAAWAAHGVHCLCPASRRHPLHPTDILRNRCFWPQVVRRIDVAARGVHWSEGGSLVAIAAESSFYLLEYNRDAAEAALASGQVRVPAQLPLDGHSMEGGG